MEMNTFIYIMSSIGWFCLGFITGNVLAFMDISKQLRKIVKLLEGMRK